MKETTNCFILRPNAVLLGMKLRGFGAGKWNAFGGKVEKGETIKEAALRELWSESKLTAKPENLKQAAFARFSFEDILRFTCHIFLLYTWEGEPQETEEMRPQWFPLDQLPFDEMWAADCRWIPRILAGETLTIDINFSADGETVKDYHCEPAHFD